MVSGSLARRYAKALLSIGVEHNNFDALNTELQRAAKVFTDHTEIGHALESPVVPMEKRREILIELSSRLSLSPTMKNTLLLLLERSRIGAVPAIARAHRALVDEQAGRIRASITSATPLAPATEARLKAALEKASGKTVVLEKHEDPTLLGGLVTQLGDTQYDGSVRSRLRALREQLLSEQG